MNAEIPPPGTLTPPPPLTPAEEHNWAMLAHLSALVNLFTGFLGIIAALVIYLVYRERSGYVRFQALQALVFQLVAWLGGGIIAGLLWALGGALSVICIGILIFPLALLVSLLPVGSLVYSIIAAVETNQGRDFQYWLVGKWVRGMLA